MKNALWVVKYKMKSEKHAYLQAVEMQRDSYFLLVSFSKSTLLETSTFELHGPSEKFNRHNNIVIVLTNRHLYSSREASKVKFGAHSITWYVGIYRKLKCIFTIAKHKSKFITASVLTFANNKNNFNNTFSDPFLLS